MTTGLHTSKGPIPFPTFFPVTTFGRSFEVDEFIRPHLDRFCPAILSSLHYARPMVEAWDRPLFIDSGGFASLMEGSSIVDFGGTHGIETADGTITRADEVLSIQEAKAEIGATLDFIVTPSMDASEADFRQEITIRNAHWALRHRQRRDLFLYASVQAWDRQSTEQIMNDFAGHPFDGFALGGMIPRLSKPEQILEIVETIRQVDSVRPLHVFGVGVPSLMRRLFDAGVSSTDSSTYVRQAISGRYLDPESGKFKSIEEIPNPSDQCDCAVCRTFDQAYLALEGPLNRMALSLHNLHALLSLSSLPVNMIGKIG
jgi:7-cyano-7-deazaguanine tRNA-ribosyltransferase